MPKIIFTRLLLLFLLIAFLNQANSQSNFQIDKVHGEYKVVVSPQPVTDNLLGALLEMSGRNASVGFFKNGRYGENSNSGLVFYDYKSVGNYLIVDNSTAQDRYGNQLSKAAVSPYKIVEIVSVSRYGYLVCRVYHVTTPLTETLLSIQSTLKKEKVYHSMVLKSKGGNIDYEYNSINYKMEDFIGDYTLGGKQVSIHPDTILGKATNYCKIFGGGSWPGEVQIVDNNLQIFSDLYLPLAEQDGKLYLLWLGYFSRKYENGKVVSKVFKEAEVSDRLYAKYGFFDSDNFMTVLHRMSTYADFDGADLNKAISENKWKVKNSVSTAYGKYWFDNGKVQYTVDRSKLRSTENIDKSQYVGYSLNTNQKRFAVQYKTSESSPVLKAVYSYTLFSRYYLYLELVELFIGDSPKNHLVQKTKERVLKPIPTIREKEEVVIDTIYTPSVEFEQYALPINGKKYIHFIKADK